ncbi:hypothetical protein BN946_scf184867.g15 [Trametes cinnabarina]|uniref:Homeobox domain-containing protein n=1 Tax=Pycnoporus cinnabarinus TaxID=5643 RepID=A0A060SIT7_PYCCI|nr:hypothetical protein BN946_scf184867.g15 [Trametes cinnabarina]
MASQLLSRTSSTSSACSDDSLASASSNATLAPADGFADGPKRTRKRFNTMQLMMLEHLYHKASHPTREQREQLAKDAEISDVRSVTVWFQNKRQTDRRIHRQLSEPEAASFTLHPRSSPTPSYYLLPPSSPFSDASGKTIHTVRARTLSSTSTGSASSLSTSNRKRERTSENEYRNVRHKPSRHLSLDAIAARTERPVLIPRTPPQCIASSSSPARVRTPEPPSEDGSCTSTGSKALWENMQSSPVAPEPAPRVEREIVRYGRKKYTLEYACAKEMVGGKVHVKAGKDKRKAEGSGSGVQQRTWPDAGGLGSPLVPVGKSKSLASCAEGPREGAEDELDIPMLEWDVDAHGDADTEGAPSPSEVVTPSGSFSIGELSVMERHKEKENAASTAATAEAGSETNDSRAREEEDIMDVAYVLCGLSQRC